MTSISEEADLTVYEMTRRYALEALDAWYRSVRWRRSTALTVKTAIEAIWDGQPNAAPTLIRAYEQKYYAVALVMSWTRATRHPLNAVFPDRFAHRYIVATPADIVITPRPGDVVYVKSDGKYRMGDGVHDLRQLPILAADGGE